jgi:rhodanese-related sulfurtransferase
LSAEPGLEIDASAFAELKARTVPHSVLDVREPWETAICALEDSLMIPMREIPGRLAELHRDDVLVVVCHHGNRSLQVASWLRGQGFGRATSLAGGLDAWANGFAPDMARY